MNIKEIKKEHWLIGALLVLAISIFLPWISIKIFMVELNITGWSISWVTKTLFFITLLIGGLVFFKKEIGSKASLGLSIGILAYLVYKIIFPQGMVEGYPINFGLSNIFNLMGYGAYIFLISTVVVGILGWKVMKE